MFDRDDFRAYRSAKAQPTYSANLVRECAEYHARNLLSQWPASASPSSQLQHVPEDMRQLIPLLAQTSSFLCRLTSIRLPSHVLFIRLQSNGGNTRLVMDTRICKSAEDRRVIENCIDPKVSELHAVRDSFVKGTPFHCSIPAKICVGNVVGYFIQHGPASVRDLDTLIRVVDRPHNQRDLVLSHHRPERGIRTYHA